MVIEKDKAVTFHYTLTNENGEILDSSSGRDPLAYIQGSGGIIPGLEKAMEGKTVGDSFSTVVPPEEAYGVYQENMIQDVALEEFQNKDEVKIGAQFQVSAGEHIHIATVTEIEDGVVTLDLNHPLADTTLHFDVDIVAIRDATDEELSHGHVHGEGDHHH